MHQRKCSVVMAFRRSTPAQALDSDEHEEASAWVGRSQAVPLDLHQVVPVPWEVLKLGPDAPGSMRWLWRHWATTWPQRRVERLPCPDGAWRVGFW